ncbi:hypothetical protein B4N89_02270 [Embleya scabrispora]|uniref:Uncharacterized protein n=1 Tax=Embleya scabrispora TaxID=159449 RepID=A0A1T3NT22_9ACTN|nr:hypothetical protein [Embleya scabrispora]OPC79924.1 hypothetical protein B4N89_02270 [Embleya scabrispora]
MADDTVRVESSGDPDEQVRIHLPGRTIPDITRDEAAALYRQLGAYLIRTIPAQPLRAPTSRG